MPGRLFQRQSLLYKRHRPAEILIEMAAIRRTQVTITRHQATH